MVLDYMDFVSKLPADVINNHIIPYTYSPQPCLLRKDIKTYMLTYNKLLELGNIAYNSYTKKEQNSIIKYIQ